MITPPYYASQVKKSIQQAMVTKFLAIVLVIGLLLSFSYVFITTGFDREALASNLTTDSILSKINSERKKANLRALKVDPKLTMAAENKAEDMGSKLYFDHYSPVGKRGISFISDTGLKYKMAAENLAVLFSDSQELVESWMASFTHKKNILKPEFELTGIGLYAGTFEGYKTTYVVQFFADNPQPASIKPATNLKGTAPNELKVAAPVQETPKELSEEEKQAIIKEENKKQFQNNFENTKQENITDIQTILGELSDK